MGRFLLALVGSLLTGVYWWIVFAIVYADALFAGDRRPDVAPASDSATISRNLAVIVGAVVVYAALSLVWRKLSGGLANRADRR